MWLAIARNRPQNQRMTNTPFDEGLARSALGLALIGIAVNDSGLVSGTGQGNLGVTVPLALAGIVGAYLARGYYRRNPRSAAAQAGMPEVNASTQKAFPLLEVLAFAAPMLFLQALSRPALIAGVGLALLVSGVRGHLRYMARQPAR